MIEVGITGGIGSGKSVLAKILVLMGYPVFYSDEVSKNILVNDSEVARLLKENFGPTIFSKNKPDRKKIAELVFKNENLLKILNEILHPRVALAYENWKGNQKGNLVFKEAAILIESGSYKNLNEIILVVAPSELRISRVVKRDNLNPTEVERRIKNQMSDKEKEEYADFIVVNDNHHSLLLQIRAILNQLNS